MSLRLQMVLFQFLLYCVLIIGFDSTQGSNIEPKRLCTVLFYMSRCLGEVFVCSGRGRELVLVYTRTSLTAHVCGLVGNKLVEKIRSQQHWYTVHLLQNTMVKI